MSLRGFHALRGMLWQEDWSGWVGEHPHRGRGRRDGIQGFRRGDMERDGTLEMLIKKISKKGESHQKKKHEQRTNV